MSDARRRAFVRQKSKLELQLNLHVFYSLSNINEYPSGTVQKESHFHLMSALIPPL